MLIKLVRIARRQTLVLEVERARHRQFDDAKASALLVGHAPKATEVRGERRVVLFIRVVLTDRDDRARRDATHVR